MALYAFDGTWNEDEGHDIEDTNVVRFKELYQGNNAEYMEGVGTRFGIVGKFLGGIFGAGGQTRIKEMYDELCENYANGDKEIDIIGFSRGAALAVHFANKIGKEGIQLKGGQAEKPRVRFLGLWDIVGSFGLSFNNILNFQEINLGYDIETVNKCVDNCFHAMALDERRESFNVTRLDPDNQFNNIHEVWFRGVHSDIGGGNLNVQRSNIALKWMLDQARNCGLRFNETKAKLPRYDETDPLAPIFENKDVALDPRRQEFPNDEYHPTALGKNLGVGESQVCTVVAKLKYNWSGVVLKEGQQYSFVVPPNDQWKDDSIDCGPAGWETEQLPWYKEGFVKLFEKHRRHPKANWFALIGAYGDEDEHLFPIGDNQNSITATRNDELYLFANDMDSRYGNNDGSLQVTITRTA